MLRHKRIIFFLLLVGFAGSIYFHWYYIAIGIFCLLVIPFLLKRLYKLVIRKIKRSWHSNIGVAGFQSWARTRQYRSDINKIVYKALENIDSLHRNFNDENEANKQLFISLKSMCPKLHVIYEPSYYDENIGDLQIGNTVIEGKLDLKYKRDVDRLIGQIQFCYSYTPFKMIVVGYGYLDNFAIERISSLPYKDRVSIVALPNPNRMRR